VYAAVYAFTILGSRRGTRLCTTVRRFAMPRRYVHGGEKLAFWMRVSRLLSLPFPLSVSLSLSLSLSLFVCLYLLCSSMRGNRLD